MITLDGSHGEGGGQILRTALALSLVTGTPFTIRNIRAGRAKPGLLRQHAAAVDAARQVGGAEVEGGEVGSRELVFRPGAVRGGDYHFAVGSAGSATLVFQTVFPALMLADAPSALTLEGGTHNPSAPPFDFLEQVFAPLMRRMGAGLALALERHGFYPAGGGRFTAKVAPVAREALKPLSLMRGGKITRQAIHILVSHLPPQVAEREVKALRRSGYLDEGGPSVEILHVDSAGPGNALLWIREREGGTEVHSSFGARGVSSEQVVENLIRERSCRGWRTYAQLERAGLADESRSSDEVPVGQYLADQLLIPLALAGSGEFLTGIPTGHTRTNAEVIREFLPVAFEMIDRDPHRETDGAGCYEIRVESRDARTPTERKAP